MSDDSFSSGPDRSNASPADGPDGPQAPGAPSGHTSVPLPDAAAPRRAGQERAAGILNPTLALAAVSPATPPQASNASIPAGPPADVAVYGDDMPPSHSALFPGGDAAVGVEQGYIPADVLAVVTNVFLLLLVWLAGEMVPDSHEGANSVAEMAAAAVLQCCLLRQLLLSRGSVAQVQVCQDPVFPALCSLVRCAETPPKVAEAACRVLCTLAAKNPHTCALVLEAEGVVEAMCRLVARSAEHVASGEACVNCAAATPVADGDGGPQAFSHNNCTFTAPACGAMWALCALAQPRNPSFHSLLLHTPSLLRHIILHLASVCEEAVSASAWLLCNAAMHNPSLPPVLVTAGVVFPLVAVLMSGPHGSRGLAAWAVRAIVVGNSRIQAAFDEAGLLPALLLLLLPAVPFPSQASGLWALTAFLSNNPAAQHRMRDADGMAGLRAVVTCLSSPSPQVQAQAAGCVYACAARCPDNQTALGDLGAVERLVELLLASEAAAVAVVREKAISALISLVVKHPANQKRMGAARGVMGTLAKLLSGGDPRMQGLCAGTVRSLAADQPELQTLLVAHGVLPPLLSLCACKDMFAREQGVAALANLTPLPPNQHFLRALGPEVHLSLLLADCSKSSRLALTAALIVLFTLCESDPGYIAVLVGTPGLSPSLLRLCQPAVSDPRLRAQADRLLALLDPPAYAQRVTLAPPAMLDALTPVCGAAPPCAVCGEVYSEADPGVFLPCIHCFHLCCVRDWLAAGRDACPLCATPILANIFALTGCAETAVPTPSPL